MSELSINDLPTEVIIEILRRVDQDSIANVILTCKLWKQLIESTRLWYFELHHSNICDINEPWMDFLLTTNRKFHTIKINGLKELGKNSLIEIFERLGRNVVKLIMNESRLDRCSLFIKLLKCLPNLEHFIGILVLSDWGMSDTPAHNYLPEMKKLKTFEAVVCGTKLIRCFVRSQLETIKFLNFSGYGRPRENVEHKAIVDLLRCQKLLKTLALRAIYYDNFELFHTNMLATPTLFQLTRLSLLDFKLRETPNDFNNLLAFLKCHMQTIKELELGRKFPKSIYQFVFDNFTRLQFLRLRINELPDDMELKENVNINNITLIDFPPVQHGCPLPFKEFLTHLPNVTELTLLENGDAETLLFIATTLTKLNKLNVNELTSSMFDGIHLSKLISLNIRRLDAEFDWNGFTTANSTITELTIETALNGCLDSTAIEKISKNLKLRTLEIGSGFPADKHFYDIIRTNCSDMKILKLHYSCAIDSNINGLSDIPGLFFYDKKDSCFDSTLFWINRPLPDDRGSDYQMLGGSDVENDIDIGIWEDDVDEEDDFDGEDDFDEEVDHQDEIDFDMLNV